MTQSAFFAFLLVIGSTLTALLIGETGLQLFYRLQKGEWLWENSAFRIGYTQPVNDGRQYTLRPRYEDARIGLVIDANGFRRTVPDKTKEKHIIVCIGDSVPFGAGVRDEETYPSLVAAKLDSLDAGIGVLNAGVASYNLRQSFDRLKKDVFVNHPHEHIQLVTVEAANDISLLTYYGANWTPELTWAEVRWSGSWGQPAFKRLAVFHYLERFLDFSRFTKPNRSLHVQAAPNYEIKRKEMFAYLRKLLHQELASLQQLSIQVILMPINPFYYQLSRQETNGSLKNWKDWKRFVDDWDQLIREYNDMLLEISKQFPNVHYLDLRLIMDSGDRNTLYLDYMHYTPAGNKLVADHLVNFLMDNRLLQRIKSSHPPIHQGKASASLHG